MSDIATFASRKPLVRILLIVSIAAVVAFVWIAGRWQIGDMLATLTRSDDDNAFTVSQAALGLAPGDPSASVLAGLSGTDPIPHLEQAVRLAPADFRWRIELGRALEQDDQLDRARCELQKAVELAPNYSPPHWHLGNFYLRRGREGEAVAELRKAAHGNRTYREQVFSLAWEIFGRDASKMEEFADEPEGMVDLSYFLAGRGRGDAALRVWNRLSDDEKARRAPLARSIARGLFIQHVYPEALEFSRQLGFDPEAKVETVANGSFENSLEPDENSLFGWQIARNDPKVEIAADTKGAHQGRRGLRIVFKSFSKPTLLNLLQTVAVAPNQRYRLTFWVRSEGLRSAGMPMVEVLNANTNETLARSSQFPSGTADWQLAEIHMRTAADCNGITLRLIRAACGEDCPITGTAWLDDFELVREVKR